MIVIFLLYYHMYKLIYLFNCSHYLLLSFGYFYCFVKVLSGTENIENKSRVMKRWRLC